MSKALLLKTLIILLVLVAFVLGFQGYVLGINTLQAVGVEATDKDLVNTELMLGKEFVTPTSNPYAQLKQSGMVPVGVTFSEAEFSAHIMAMHPIANITTQFGQDTFEISGTIDRDRLQGFKDTLGIESLKLVPLLAMIEKFTIVDPTFYFSGKGGVYENEVKIELDAARIGKIKIPLEFASKSIKNYFELVFKQAPAFSGEDISLQPDFLWFYGTATQTVPRY
jgi:hypothetical protein